MATLTKEFFRDWKIDLNKELIVDYYPVDGDYGHLQVCRFLDDGSREIIGYVYSYFDGERTQYNCSNAKGRVLFPTTPDFNRVNQRFERYARQISLDRGPTLLQIQKDNYSLTKNQITMQTNQTNPESQQRKTNQLIFVEYEKATGDGHMMTVADSYRNVIGRIHRSYNDQTKKYEYAAYDHAGKLMSQSEKLWELKKEFTNNREQLLSDAHQRRIASKGKAKESPEAPAQPAKTEERQKETQKVRETKGKQVSKTKSTQAKSKAKATTKQTERELELDEARNVNDEREDMGIEY